MKTTVKELKDLMLEIGIEKEIVDRLDPAVPIIRQGIDSVDCPAFIASLEMKYGIRVSDEDGLRLKTINDYVAFLSR